MSKYEIINNIICATLLGLFLGANVRIARMNGEKSFIIKLCKHINNKLKEVINGRK